MNIQLFRLRPLIKELTLIRRELTRIADNLEADALSKGIEIKIRPPEKEGDVAYTNEEQDWERENIERLARAAARDEEEERAREEAGRTG